MANKFETAKVKAEILERVYNSVKDMRDQVTRDWRDLGTTHQEKNWRTDELVWEDEEKTIPHMVKDYGYVDKTSDEYTEADKIQMKVLDEVLAYIEKLV